MMIYSLVLTKSKNEKYIVLSNLNTYVVIVLKITNSLVFFFSKKKLDVTTNQISNNITIKFTTEGSLKKKLSTYIENIDNNTYSLFYSAAKFTGKGYRLSSIKAKKVIEPFFGYSHIVYLYCGLINFKRAKKVRYFFWSNNKKAITNMSIIINSVKPINVYTLRGLRTTKRKIIKRKGRKSPSL